MLADGVHSHPPAPWGESAEHLPTVLHADLASPAPPCLSVQAAKAKQPQKAIEIFEAMTAVIYRPEALMTNTTDTRNTLTSKHCAASANADGQNQMISNTIVAALKQGLSPLTSITALCDGADNCWRIVDALKPLAGGTLCILDWFHLQSFSVFI